MEGSPRVLGWTGPRSLQAMEVGAEVCAVGSRPGLPDAMRCSQTCGENEGIWPGYHWTCATATLVFFFLHNYVNRMNKLKKHKHLMKFSKCVWNSMRLRRPSEHAVFGWGPGFSFASFLVPRSQESVWYLEAAGLSLPPSSPQTPPHFVWHCFASMNIETFSECPLYYILYQLLLTSINMFSHAACTNLRGKRSVTWSWFSLREELRRQLKIVEILVTGVELRRIQVREII